ncbi:facilitated trehalose transporter Tret1-like [Euwallacea similis]|uniref:facilitated trehalose transporter Tret1-like n=1 Tax=Euwallacea similis TaxID=1736056 RepID=UPI00344D67DF
MPENKAKKLPQFFAAICISIGAMSTGTVIAWTSNISKKLEDGDLNKVKLNLSWAGSIMCLGAMCVSIPIGIMADKIGRKLTALFILIPYTTGWLLIIFTQHVAMLLVGRFLTGMGAGSFCIIGPIYTSDIAEISIRKTLGTFMQLFITLGILYANIFGWILPIITFCILCAAVPVTFGILFVFQPESPIYLIKKNKKNEALAAYAKLRGKDYDPSVEIAEAERVANKEVELKGQFKEQLKSKSGWKSSLICFMLMFYQQFCGINAVMFYSGSIFKEASSSIKPELCVCIIGLIQVIATVISAYFVDSLGLKVLLILSAGLMALSTLLMAIYFLLKDEKMVSVDTIESIRWLPLLPLILFIISFSFGMGPIPWLASSEMFPRAIMARMSSYAGIFNWFLAFVITVGYEPCSKALGSSSTFFIFTVISASAVFFVIFIVPETRGKTFEEIQDELNA